MTATSGPYVPSGIEQQPQRQDGLDAQMATVIDAARRLGCYDAMDWLLTEWAVLPALRKDRQRKIEDAYRQSLPGESYRKDRSSSGGTS